MLGLLKNQDCFVVYFLAITKYTYCVSLRDWPQGADSKNRTAIESATVGLFQQLHLSLFSPLASVVQKKFIDYSMPPLYPANWRVLTGLKTKCVEIEPPFVVLLKMRCTETPIIKLNGKYGVVEI